MKIGYARVSTADQSLALQLDGLRRAGCEQIYEERASGRAAADRPELQNLLRSVRPGDTIVIWRLDRLGRSLADLVTMVNDLAAREVALESLTERLDTSTAAGKLFLGFIALMAEFERNVIGERTKAGLAAARARGRTGGRPQAMTNQDKQLARAMLKDPQVTATEVAKRLGVSRSTLYRQIGAVPPLKSDVGPAVSVGSKRHDRGDEPPRTPGKGKAR